MRRRVGILLYIVLLYVLQTAVPFRNVFSVTPALLLVPGIAAGFLNGRREGLVYGFLCGLLIDLYNGDLLGLYACMYMLCGYMAGRFERIYFEQNVLMPTLFVGVSDFVIGTISYFALFFIRGRLMVVSYFLQVILPEALVSALFATVVYYAFYKINHGLRRLDERGKVATWLKE